MADLDSDASPAPEGPASDGFVALDLDPRLLSTIAALGYEEPTPIQREAIPPLLAARIPHGHCPWRLADDLWRRNGEHSARPTGLPTLH